MQRPAHLRWSPSTKPFGPHTNARRPSGVPSKWTTMVNITRPERRVMLFTLLVTACILLGLGTNLLFFRLTRRTIKVPAAIDAEEAKLMDDAPLIVLPRSPDTCAAALKIDRVALLFLTSEGFKQPEVWQLWFASAEGLVPLENLQTKGCIQDGWDAIVEDCPSDTSASIIDQQHMFSVYVHAQHNSSHLLSGTVFEGHRIPKPVATEWGTHSLVSATKRLLIEALQDPLNAYFVLLSETTIPLYPPLTVYRQLLAEDKSRVNACPLGKRDLGRWTGRMERDWLKRSHWRKSWQWFGLMRRHAALVVQDRKVDYVFNKYCRIVRYDPDYKEERFCVSDEHYVPTLLASKGMDRETDCHGLLTHVDFSRGGPHPRAYTADEVTVRLLKKLRGKEHHCDYEKAISSAPATFVRLDANLSSMCQQEPIRYQRTLEYDCPLFARKFPEESSEKLLNLLASCDRGLQILPQSRSCQSPPHRQPRGFWSRLLPMFFFKSSRKS